MRAGSFTERVRQELSRVEVPDDEPAVERGSEPAVERGSEPAVERGSEPAVERGSEPAVERGSEPAVVELAVLLRLAGRFHRVGTADGSRTTLEVTSSSGAVVRRVYGLLPRVTPAHSQVWVREPGGVRSGATYGLVLDDGVATLARALGLTDAAGRPRSGLPASGPAPVVVRAALLTTASFSDPGRAAHLEVRAPSVAVGEGLRDAFEALGVAGHLDRERARVVVKSSAGAATLLAAAGAPDAAAELDQQRHRRRLRNDATRLANADASNVARTIEAAQEQLRVIQSAVDVVGWTGLDEPLRTVALARLVNPSASLAELGQLCDPPVGKSAVHRRLQRLAELGNPGSLGGRGTTRR